MDTVLAAFVAIFIILFAGFSLATTMLSTQNELRIASQSLQSRLDTRARTMLDPVGGQITNEGSVVELVFRNTGTIKLADLEQWDIIIEYTDDADGYHVNWVPYVGGIPINNEWALSGIYLNTAQSLPESYERGIINSGEELKLTMRLTPPVGHGKTVAATISTPNGISATLQVTRNILPTLAVNTGITVPSGRQAMIDCTQLAATELDNTPDELVYTLVTQPMRGTLSLGATFTQADINAGLLIYTRTGEGADLFTFTLSDGTDSLGTTTFIVNP